MSQLDDITIEDWGALVRAICVLGIWEDLPFVVGVVEWITSDLLTLAGNPAIVISERILVWMAVEICFGILVSQDDGIVVLDVDGSLMHEVVTQSLLEFGGHKVVAGTRSGQDGEMDLKPEEVEEEWNDDEAYSACGKVLPKGEKIQSSTFTLNIEKVPEVDQNRATDGEEGESTDILGGYDTAHAEAGQQQPLPPFAAKWGMSLLVKLDIGQDAEGHEEDEGGIE